MSSYDTNHAEFHVLVFARFLKRLGKNQSTAARGEEVRPLRARESNGQKNQYFKLKIIIYALKNFKFLKEIERNSVNYFALLSELVVSVGVGGWGDIVFTHPEHQKAQLRYWLRYHVLSHCSFFFCRKNSFKHTLSCGHETRI